MGSATNNNPYFPEGVQVAWSQSLPGELCLPGSLDASAIRQFVHIINL